MNRRAFFAVLLAPVAVATRGEETLPSTDFFTVKAEKIKPVIATPVRNYRDMVTLENTGIVYPDGTAWNFVLVPREKEAK